MVNELEGKCVLRAEVALDSFNSNSHTCLLSYLVKENFIVSEGRSFKSFD